MRQGAGEIATKIAADKKKETGSEGNVQYSMLNVQYSFK
jgi:hypothetical protein